MIRLGPGCDMFCFVLRFKVLAKHDPEVLQVNLIPSELSCNHFLEDFFRMICVIFRIKHTAVVVTFYFALIFKIKIIWSFSENMSPFNLYY